MERIENVTRERLVDLIAGYIKGESKKMGGSTNMMLDVDYVNCTCGMGMDRKWAYSEIMFGGKAFVFKDREITDYGFISMLNKALEKSGVRGKVFYEEYEGGYFTSSQVVFDRLEIFAKPCKEFNSLNKALVKYGVKPIGEFDVFSVGISGKRNSYSDDGNFRYLCHQPKLCLSIIDYIKANKGRNGVVMAMTKDYVDHGDETDYRIAQYQESEWDGRKGRKLILTIKGGKNKKDYTKEIL